MVLIVAAIFLKLLVQLILPIYLCLQVIALHNDQMGLVYFLQYPSLGLSYRLQGTLDGYLLLIKTY